MYYKGYYHLFYQYNPKAPIWGNIVWGHAVSTDLLRWHYLEPAMKGDHWYDERGVWSGSATFMEDGSPVLLYTGESINMTQVQNMAVPANKSDPLLLEWVKVSQTSNFLQLDLKGMVTCCYNKIYTWRDNIFSSKIMR